MNGRPTNRVTSHTSRRLRNSAALFLAMFMGLAIRLSAADGVEIWTNQPAGFQVALDCPFDDLKKSGIDDVYSSSIMDTDATTPVSPPGVVRSTIHAGNNSGGMQLGFSTPQIYREMYVGLMWRTNPEFEGRTVCNKLFFVRGPRCNGFFGMDGGPSQQQPDFYIMFGPNSGGLDNSHSMGGDGFIAFPNVSSGVVKVGAWNKIEAYIKSSTTTTSRDGIVRWWVNDVKAGEYTDANYAAEGLNEWVWSETWDGYVKPVPTVDWSHYVDHLHIAVPASETPAAESGTPEKAGGDVK